MDPKIKRYELISLVICNVALYFKMFVVASATGFYRQKEGVLSNKEDQRFTKKEPVKDAKDSMTARIRRIHRNDLENILPFLMIAVSFYLAGNNVATSIAGIILYALFTITR